MVDSLKYPLASQIVSQNRDKSCAPLGGAERVYDTILRQGGNRPVGPSSPHSLR